MSDSQKWLVLVGVAATAWLFYLLTPILTPFAIGAGIAYLGDPLADRRSLAIQPHSGGDPGFSCHDAGTRVGSVVIGTLAPSTRLAVCFRICRATLNG